MTVSAKLFGKALLSITSGLVDWTNDTIKCALTGSAFSPNQDTMDFFDDVTNEVATASGYTAGGVTITGSATYTASNNMLMLDANDASWADSCISARYAIVYDATPGTAGTNPLICYTDFGETVTSSSGTFLVAWNSAGIVNITAS
jgi:hypothetical protein